MAESIQRLLDKPETRGHGLNLIAAAEKTDAAAQVAKVAADAKEAEAVRVAAVQTLGVLPSNDGAAALAKLLDDGSPAVRAEAAPALGKLAQRKADQPGAAAALTALQDRLHPQGRGPRRAPGGGVGAGGTTAGVGVAAGAGGEEAVARRRAARRGPAAAQQPLSGPAK